MIPLYPTLVSTDVITGEKSSTFIIVFHPKAIVYAFLLKLNKYLYFIIFKSVCMALNGTFFLLTWKYLTISRLSTLVTEKTIFVTKISKNLQQFEKQLIKEYLKYDKVFIIKLFSHILNDH